MPRSESARRPPAPSPARAARVAGALGPAAGLVAGALLAGAAPAADFQKSVRAEDGGQLRIELAGGSLEIETHREPEVRVDAYAQGLGARSLDFELRRDEDEVRLSSDAGGLLGSLLGGGARVRVRVRVPEDFSVDARTGGGSIALEQLRGDVRAHTSGGAVEVDRVEGDVQLETSGGPVEVSRVRGDVVARTSGGRVRADEIEGEVEARSSGGPIEIRDAEGPVDARTDGGDIFVRFTGEPEGHIETSGGDIEIEIPAEEGAELDARTSGGRVEIEPPLRFRGQLSPSEVRGEIGEGGGALVLRTSGGNIRIRLR